MKMETWFGQQGEVGSGLKQLVWVWPGQEEERKTDRGKRGQVVVCWCWQGEEADGSAKRGEYDGERFGWFWEMKEAWWRRRKGKKLGAGASFW